MNPVEQVRERLDGGRRWCKGNFGDIAGNRCLVGAARYGGAISAVPPIAAVIQEQYPERLTPFVVHVGGGGIVAIFNDHPDTIWADVDLVLDKASVLWDERYGGAS
jgi:hypothetical protein